MSHAIKLTNVSHAFELNNERIELFNDINLTTEQGQSYAITGPSGTGKSSLLMLASGLEEVTQGTIEYLGEGQCRPISELRAELGFIFQQFHLLPELTALNNVALPLKLRGDKDAFDKAHCILERVGLSHRESHTPSQLSGGEQQRVAIARALIFKPKFIFADEPTGNLDPKTADQITEILFSTCYENNAGLIVVTHCKDVARQANQIYTLSKGTLFKNDEQRMQEVAC